MTDAPMPDPLPPPPPPVPAPRFGDPIAAALRATVAEIQAILARLDAPARRDHVDVAGGIATPGGPVSPPSEGGRTGGVSAAPGAVAEGFSLPLWPGTRELAESIRRSVLIERRSPLLDRPIPLGEGPLYDALPRWSR